jgi:hypothetical protein
VAPGREWYRRHLSPLHRLVLLSGSAFPYLRQFLFRPYRRDLRPSAARGAARCLTGRHAAAALDLWVERFLGTFRSVAGYSPRRESGQLAIRYMRLMAAINLEFEHRLATGQDLGLERVCGDPLVLARLTEWRQFTAAHCGAPDLADFLAAEDGTADYAAYAAMATAPGFHLSPESQIQSMRIDSGRYLMQLVSFVDQFNWRTSAADVLAAFFELGMAAKFADELTDLPDDCARGRYNLLLAMLARRPAEQNAIIARIRAGRSVPIGYWSDFAPRTFDEFMSLFEAHYLRLDHAALRSLCELTMLRAARGSKRATSRRHITERPAEPRR